MSRVLYNTHVYMGIIIMLSPTRFRSAKRVSFTVHTRRKRIIRKEKYVYRMLLLYVNISVYGYYNVIYIVYILLYYRPT